MSRVVLHPLVRATAGAAAIFICLSSPLVLRAQNSGSVRGVVKLEAGGAPLRHAHVLLVPGGRSTESGDDGSFELRNVPPGNYEVVAHMHSLTDERRKVEVKAGETAEVSFALKLSAIRQEITVTAGGKEEIALEAFQTATAVDNIELTNRSQGAGLGELLENEMGVAKRSFGPGTSRPVVRGFDGDRVLVLQDGMRTGTLSSQSGDHGEPIDPASMERVEVVRGPANLLYGNNAIGGVVNVLSQHHQLDAHTHSGVRGRLSGTGGTANALGGGSGSVEIGAKDWLFWLGGSGIRAGDYNTPLGKVENSGNDIRQMNGGVGRYWDRVSFTLNYGIQDGAYGVPFVHELAEHGHGGEDKDGKALLRRNRAGEDEHEEEFVRLKWRRHNVRFNGTVRELGAGLEQMSATANYSDWTHRELENGAVGTEFFNKQFTYQSHFRQRKKGLLSGTFGFWGLHRDYETRGAESLAPPTDQNAFALFGVEELAWENGLRLQAGGRLETNRYNARPRPDGERVPNRSFTGFSGALGAAVPLWTGGSLVANYTRSYRAPALEELYNRGPHAGNLTYENGNPNLTREAGNGFELGVRHQSGRLRGQINTFYYRFADFIYFQPTGKFEDGLPEADVLQADSRYIGAEAKIDAAITRDLWLNLGFDLVDAQLRQNSQSLPRIPPVRGRLGVTYSRSGLTLRPEWVLANHQRAISPVETPTAGYGVFNLTGGYTIARRRVMHHFGGTWFNAANQLYRNHLSFIKDFAPEIGRGVRFSYTMNFY